MHTALLIRHIEAHLFEPGVIDSDICRYRPHLSSLSVLQYGIAEGYANGAPSGSPAPRRYTISKHTIMGVQLRLNGPVSGR